MPDTPPRLIPEPDNRTKASPSMRRVVGSFAASNFVTTILRLIGGVLTSRFVDPIIMGQYNAIGLIQGYAPFLQIGIGNGLTRDLPYYIGRGEMDHAHRLVAAAQWWTLRVSTLIGLVMACVGFYHLLMGQVDLAFGWWSYIVIVLFAIFGQQFLRSLFRTGGEFITLGTINLIDGVLALVLIFFVWLSAWWGMCLRGMAVAAIGLLLLWRWRPIRVASQYDFRCLVDLAKTGIPIFAVGQLLAWWNTLNATLVLHHGDKTMLGLYALSNMAGPTVFLLPQALNSVIYPKMSSAFGKASSIRKLVKMTLKPMAVTIATCLVTVVLGWFAMPPIVRILLPKYIEGIEAAQWSLAAAGILAFSTVNNVFIVTKHQGRYALAIITGMIAYYGVLQALLLDGLDLSDFSIALLLGRSIFLLISYGMIGQMLWKESRNPKAAFNA